MSKSSSFLSGRPVFLGPPLVDPVDFKTGKTAKGIPGNTGIAGGLNIDNSSIGTKAEKILRSKDFQELEINLGDKPGSAINTDSDNFKFLVIGLIAYFFLKG